MSQWTSPWKSCYSRSGITAWYASDSLFLQGYWKDEKTRTARYLQIDHRDVGCVTPSYHCQGTQKMLISNKMGSIEIDIIWEDYVKPRHPVTVEDDDDIWWGWLQWGECPLLWCPKPLLRCWISPAVLFRRGVRLWILRKIPYFHRVSAYHHKLLNFWNFQMHFTLQNSDQIYNF